MPGIAMLACQGLLEPLHSLEEGVAKGYGSMESCVLFTILKEFLLLLVISDHVSQYGQNSENFQRLFYLSSNTFI